MLLEIADRPIWWIVLYFVPVVNIIIWIMMCIGVADAFGRNAGFGIGLALLPFIFFPILAFTE